jgi:hypothetical protein
MSKDQNEVKAAAVVADNVSFGQRMARWIDDPFASVIVGIVMPAIASSLVLSGIWALGTVS